MRYPSSMITSYCNISLCSVLLLKSGWICSPKNPSGNKSSKLYILVKTPPYTCHAPISCAVLFLLGIAATSTVQTLRSVPCRQHRCLFHRAGESGVVLGILFWLGVVDDWGTFSTYILHNIKCWGIF